MTATSSNSTKIAAEAAIPPKPESGPVVSIDFAHLVEKRLIVYGWVLGFAKAVDRASIEIDGVVVELARRQSLSAGLTSHNTFRLNRETTSTAFMLSLTFRGKSSL